MYICNSFSLNMLPEWVAKGQIKFSRLSQAEAAALARTAANQHGLESAVGHADTAAVFSALLGVGVPMNRASVRLLPGIAEHMLVGQMTGPRMPEGATTLPEGAEVQWVLIKFGDDEIIEFAPYADEEE